MPKLYLQIYTVFLGILLLFGGLVTVVSLLLPVHRQEHLEELSVVLHELLPGPEQPLAELQAAVAQLERLFPVQLEVRSATGTLLAATRPPLPPPPPPLDRLARGWMRVRGDRPPVALALPDGRVVVARRHPPRRRLGFVGALGLLASAMVLGTYPLVRRITRRLERLQTQVEALGAGDLTVRVEVSGRDEVAQLARSFNRAADRIARLVNAQRTMLASASHELRSPLARIRMAIELLPHDARPELRARLTHDIAELDTLIGELLLASRLDTLEHLEHTEEVDLLALLAEEGARSAADVSGAPVYIQGDPRMLRRLLRNLFENAQRYAAGSPIAASVVPLHPTGARLCIADRGPGVPAQEREQIFAPFYRSAGMREHGDGGVGLGLALVRQIARHHGGDVRCVPRQGGGTCFEVTLHAVPGVGQAPGH
jgi:signal transduction histidine kinase